MAKLYLKLASGHTFEGEAFGASGSVSGEIVFSTSMVGYLETLSDPRYYGQLVVQTFPMIGNYGVIPDELSDSNAKLSAYIVREYCQEPSNFRSEGKLDDFLLSRGIIGMCGVDTRELTRVIREHGVMNARICESADDETDFSSFAISGALAVAARADYPKTGFLGSGPKVAVWDFGQGSLFETEMKALGCAPAIFGYNESAETILAAAPDGVVLTGGPGDPRENPGVIAEIKKLADRGLPILAVGLGHQMLALAMGLEVEKLKYGHRGSQPVIDMSNSRVYTTSQNHGYAVRHPKEQVIARASFKNANDLSCEGLEYPGKPFVSLQFVPQKGKGLAGMSFIYERFVSLMEVK